MNPVISKTVRRTIPVTAAFALAASATPASAGPEEWALPPRAVVPHPVVVDSAPATLTYSRHARSEWELTSLDRSTNTALVTHAESGISLTIDYDDEQVDGHREGVAPDTGCGPMSGQYWGATTPLFYAILEPGKHTIEDVQLSISGGDLHVRMTGGAYELLAPGAGSEPFFMDLVFSVEDGQLRAEGTGLFYVIPSKDPGTEVNLMMADGTVEDRTYTMASPTSREYFDEVRHVIVQDGRYGDFEFTTDIERLQIDLNANPILDVFELDMDHTLKDRGQRVVHSSFTFAEDC